MAGIWDRMKKRAEEKWENDILNAAQKKTPVEIRIGYDVWTREHWVYVNDTKVHMANSRDDSEKWMYKIAQFLREKGYDVREMGGFKLAASDIGAITVDGQNPPPAPPPPDPPPPPP